MRDIVIANKNKYIYNGKLYDDISIKRVISKEIELYVMEEDLLIKTYDEIKNPPFLERTVLIDYLYLEKKVWKFQL